MASNLGRFCIISNMQTKREARQSRLDRLRDRDQHENHSESIPYIKMKKRPRKNVVVLPKLSPEKRALQADLIMLRQKQMKAIRGAESTKSKNHGIMDSMKSKLRIEKCLLPLLLLYFRQRWKFGMLRWNEHIALCKDRFARYKKKERYIQIIQVFYRYHRWRIERQCSMRKLQVRKNNALLVFQAQSAILLNRIKICRVKKTQACILMQALWRGYASRLQTWPKVRYRMRNLLLMLSPNQKISQLRHVIIFSESMQNVIHLALEYVESTRVLLHGNAPGQRSVVSRREIRQLRTPTKLSCSNSFFIMLALIRIYDTRMVEIEAAKRKFKILDARRKLRLQQEEERRQQFEMEQTHDKTLEAARSLEMEQEDHESLHFRFQLQQLEKDELEMRAKATRSLQTKEIEHMDHEDALMRRYVRALLKRERERSAAMLEVARQRAIHEKMKAEQQKHETQLEIEAKEKQHEVRIRRIHAKKLEEQKLAESYRQQQREMEVRGTQREARERAAAELHLMIMEERYMKAFICARKDADNRMLNIERLKSERNERFLMQIEDLMVRKEVAGRQKSKSQTMWERKRLEDAIEAPIDPLNLLSNKQALAVQERIRKEMNDMTREEAEKRKFDKYLRQCASIKLSKLQRQKQNKEQAFQSQQMKLMHAEDAACAKLYTAERNEINRIKLLEDMQRIAKEDREREISRRVEARERKSMYEEEMRQRRYEKAFKIAELLKEKRCRERMAKLESDQRIEDAAIERVRLRKLERKRRGEMMREDVVALRWNQLESDGRNLEQYLWQPLEVAALRQLVQIHGSFLRTNVSVFCQMANGFSKARPPLQLPFNDKATTATKCRVQDLPIIYPKDKTSQVKWGWILSAFSGGVIARRMLSVGALLMRSKEYEKMRDARVLFNRLVKQGHQWPILSYLLGKCNYLLFNVYFERFYIDHSYHYFSLASKFTEFLASPSYTAQLANVFAANNEFKSTVQLLGRVISSFPKFYRLSEVLFDTAIAMVSLKKYSEAVEYLLFLLEEKPYELESYDILFIVGRLYEFLGKKKTSKEAFEQSFKTNASKLYTSYATWKDWLADPETWIDIGDFHFKKRLFVLARDEYQQALKRRDLTETDEDIGIKINGAWLNLGICQTFFRDRKATHFALRSWLNSHSYEKRVHQRLLSWGPKDWSKLRLELPTYVINYRKMEKEKYYAEQQANIAAELSRTEARRKSIVAKEHDPWIRNVHPRTGKVFFRHEDTNEIKW